MARDRLGDSSAALQIWQGAARRAKAGAVKARCEAEAADIAVNDLLRPAVAKSLLEAAASHLGAIETARSPPPFSASGAITTPPPERARPPERLMSRPSNAWAARETMPSRPPGAAPTAARLKTLSRPRQFDRAAAEIHAWQSEFPTEKIDGYLTLLYARYWAGRKQYPQAIAQAEQLQTVTPDSPYADQLLMLAADCQLRLGRTDRAAATLHTLVKDYPGSPLVPPRRRHCNESRSKGEGGKQRIKNEG